MVRDKAGNRIGGESFDKEIERLKAELKKIQQEAKQALKKLLLENNVLHSVINTSIVSASIESNSSLFPNTSPRKIIPFKISWSLLISLPLGKVVSLYGNGPILTLPIWPSYLP